MDVYVAVGIVIGLDVRVCSRRAQGILALTRGARQVDRESFDKYTVRRGVADTLVQLWRLPGQSLARRFAADVITGVPAQSTARR